MQAERRPYFTIEGPQTGENRGMPERGNGPYLDLEQGKTDENIPSEEAIERRRTMGKLSSIQRNGDIENTERGVAMERLQLARRLSG
eukprot:Gb_40771 [translate_table: standard]